MFLTEAEQNGADKVKIRDTTISSRCIFRKCRSVQLTKQLKYYLCLFISTDQSNSNI